MAAKLTRKEKIALQKETGNTSPRQTEKKEKSSNSIKRMLGLIVAIVGFVLYSNTFNHGFVLDDFGLIKDNNQTKRGISAIPEIFKTAYRYGMNTTDYQLYRPLSKAMFAAEWSISPNNPTLGHTVNVILFAFLCYLIFQVLNRYMNGALLIPFITALLFAAHPLHTEVVANIKSRDEIVCLLLCLSAIWFLHSYVTKNSTKGFVLGIGCFFAAMFTKESAITFVAIVPLFYYFFTNTERAKYIRTFAGMAVCTAIFLLIRRSVLGNVITLIPIEDNSLIGIKNIFEQRANAIYIMGVYLKQLVFPLVLVSDGSYNTFPPVSILSWQFLVSFAIYAAAAIYAIVNFKKKNTAAFAILFFFVTVSIVSNVIILIGTNYGERLMFIPSLGFCLLIAILISKILKSESANKLSQSMESFFSANAKPLGLVAVIVILFGIQTRARNADWKSDTTLFDTDVLKVPNSAHMLFYLANHITAEDYIVTLPDSTAIMKSKMRAIECLSRTIEIYPRYADGYQRRGFILNQLGRRSEAESDFKKALEFNPTHPIVYNNYGTLCFNEHRYDEAMVYFKQAVRYNPRYAHALGNLASVYGVYGQGEAEQVIKDPANRDKHAKTSRECYESALMYFQKAIDVDPEFTEPYRLSAITYRQIGNEAEAQRFDRLLNEAIAKKKALGQNLTYDK